MNAVGFAPVAAANQDTFFNQLMRDNYRKAYSFAYRMAGNREDAEDLTQEAFVRAYRAFHRYDTSRPFERWLFRIIANLFVDKLRTRPKLAPVSLDSPMEGTDGDRLFSEIADYEADPSHVVMKEIVDETIQGALTSLPLPFRQTVLLTDVEGLSYEEAAELLGCAVGTIRSRLHRARMMMRAYMKSHTSLSMPGIGS
ncbi:MAG: sigma-70 family RNA polymerase sigma factor [Chthonomonadales bacterium]